MNKFKDYLDKKINEESLQDIIENTTEKAEMAFWASVEESLAMAKVPASIIPTKKLRMAMKDAVNSSVYSDGSEESRAFEKEFRPEPRRPREPSPEEKAFEKEFGPEEV